MAISGTQTFNLEIVDIIEDAYERAGLKLESGYDFRTGRRAIDLLMLEWQNRNIDIWMVEELYWDAYNDGGPGSDKIEAEALWNLTNSVSEYQVRTGTVELLDVVIRTGATAGTTAGTDKGKFSTAWSDTRLNRLSERAYATIQNKQTRASTGATPTSYYVKTHEILDVSVDGDGPRYRRRCQSSCTRLPARARESREVPTSILSTGGPSALPTRAHRDRTRSRCRGSTSLLLFRGSPTTWR